jgi:BirA family biotin operon repressor/biotin-[acetyl-CoA-carboxylase] ligase
VDRNALAAALIRELSALPKLDWREEYRAACVNLGKDVQILAPGQPPRVGVALDVGPNAELLVQTDAGVEAVQAGEVSVRGMYGYVP